MRFSEWFSTQAAPFLERAAPAAGKSGVVLSVGGGLTATEWAAFGGLALAALGYVTTQAMNWYYKRKEDRRREAEHKLRMTLSADARELLEQGEDE